MGLGLFVNLCAWGALILTISGLVVMLRHWRDGHVTIVGQVVGAVAAIILALGILLRDESPAYLALTCAGVILAFLSVALVVRARAC